MGFIFGLLKKLFKLFVYFLIFAAIIVLIPNLPPYTSFTRITLEPPQPLTGALAPIIALDNAEKLYTDKLLGPEAFQLYKGEVYTSLATGEIVKLSPGGHVTFVTQIGRPCTGIKQEQICGRPLGFEIDENTNQMYVADAYHGIWKVDLKTDKKQLLVSPNVEINGRKPKLFNDVALDGKGNLYWTDSSSDFNLKDGAFTMLADPSGRLFQYNAAKNTSAVLIDNLWLANGVAVSPDNQFVVVAESFANRLQKYYINGPKKGKSEVFASGLPGSPDNLRVLPDGSGLLVGVPVANDGENPDLKRSLAAAPYARKFLARLFRLIEIPFEYFNSVYPHFVFEDIVYKIGHFDSLTFLKDPAGLLQLDWNGNVVAFYLNKDNSVTFMSDAVVYNDRLYLGRPHTQNFVGSVSVPPLLKKAFSSKAVPEKKEVPKTITPKEQPRTITTTTQKPPVAAQTKPKVESKPTPPPSKATPPPTTTTKPPKLTTTQPPKTTPPPAKPSPQAAKPTATPPKPQEQKDTPKQEVPKAQPTTTQKPKPAETTKPTTKPPATKENKESTTTTPKSTTAMPKSGSETQTGSKDKVKQKESPANTPKSKDKTPPPIKEEIPSDTAKPNKETLKVIRKDGPAEIPNPNL